MWGVSVKDKVGNICEDKGEGGMYVEVKVKNVHRGCAVENKVGYICEDKGGGVC